MVLNFAGGQGLFNSRDALLKNKQNFVSMNGYGFVGGGSSQNCPRYVAGAIKFNSDGVSDPTSLYGLIGLPDKSTITKITLYGRTYPTDSGADIKWVLMRGNLITGYSTQITSEISINTETIIDIDVDTSLYNYAFYVWDDADVEANCYVHGAIVEFERLDKDA